MSLLVKDSFKTNIYTIAILVIFIVKDVSSFTSQYRFAPTTLLRPFRQHSLQEKTTKFDDVSSFQLNDDLDRLKRRVTSIAIASLTAGAIFLLPMHDEEQSTVNHDVRIHHIQPAYAATVVSKPTTGTEKIDSISNNIAMQRTTVLDEVWTLVDKYYLDQSFRGQDWSKVREEYESRLPVVNPDDYDSEEAMRLSNDMIKSLGDKYSRMLDNEAYARIQKFDLIGVGATLMPNAEKRIMVGAPPIKGSEAERVGIKQGDFITVVNGLSTDKRTAFDIINQISEQPNANSVTMTVLTEGPDKLPQDRFSRDVTMAREYQISNPVSFKISERRIDGTNVGYIRLTEFNSLVQPKLEETLRNLKKEGANAFDLDVRSNGGGAFQSAIEIAGFFIDDKVATTVVDSNQVELQFRTGAGKLIVGDDPLVIWIDRGSASATEVLAGSLHDQYRAVVMESNRFGKGLIQAVYELKKMRKVLFYNQL